MKYRRKVFDMDDLELRAVLRIVFPSRTFDKAAKADMQEELVHW